MAGEATKWALNSAQWIRTALTDIYHAVAQAEKGRRPKLVREYKAIIAELEAQDQYLQMHYSVPPPTGIGRKRERKGR